MSRKYVYGAEVTNLDFEAIVRTLRTAASLLESGDMTYLSGGIIVDGPKRIETGESVVTINSNLVLEVK